MDKPISREKIVVSLRSGSSTRDGLPAAAAACLLDYWAPRGRDDAMKPEKLTHLDSSGEARRVARAGARIRMGPETREQITGETNPKGAVLATARLAGIQAAKRTSDLIPLCHPLPLEHAEITFSWESEGDNESGSALLLVEAGVTVTARTGVEMEALTAVSVAALTIYDMCKAIDRGMAIEEIRLLEKSGGRSGHWKLED